VTTAWFTAGLFHLLVDQRLDGLRSLRQLVAAAMYSPDPCFARARRASGCRIVNGYGRREHDLLPAVMKSRAKDGAGDPFPSERLIEHTYVRLLDDDMKPVADGEVGQLCAGGSGLASGYLGDAKRTAERFVPDPYSEGARLYLTGDLARRRADGRAGIHRPAATARSRSTEKRVELGEIEEALRRNPAGHRCARDHARGEYRARV